MAHYKLDIEKNLLSIPVKTIQEHIIDYLIKNKSYMGKKMISTHSKSSMK